MPSPSLHFFCLFSTFCLFRCSTHPCMTHWVLHVDIQHLFVMHCCVDPPFFLSFVTALLNTGYFIVPPSLFKLSHGHPVLHCLLRHYVSTITGSRRSQNALSSPHVYVCILNTVKRRDSHAYTRDFTLRIGFSLSGSYWQKTLLFNSPLTVW